VSLDASIAEGVRALGIDLDAAAVAKSAQYLRLIEKWNRVHNLTAVRAPEQMVVLHLLDSLTILPYLAEARSLLDVGSGPGLPGIPVAIARPSLEVTLLDASHKKTTFLEQARTELDLANVQVACERVERWRPERTFDVVVSRAFADLGEFVAQAQHLVAPGGRMLAMKGLYPYEEIARIPASHQVSGVEELRVPHLDAKRHLVVLRKAA
jgi:16S rRNA (guanine527-N7)-methyltransferase